MFDISSVSTRYFPVHLILPDGKTVDLDVEPPKLKQLNKLLKISKADQADMIDELQTAVAGLLNKNKQGFKVPAEYVESLDIDQLTAILKAYFEWLNAERKN
jgi:hypothetical protein